MSLSKEEFHARFRGRMLLFLNEAWAMRKESPSALGMAMDQHYQSCRQLLSEMYDALCPPPAPKPPQAVNGAAQPQRKV